MSTSIREINNFPPLSIEEVEEITAMLDLPISILTDKIANAESSTLLSKYIWYAIKFKEDILFGGIFRNSHLTDEQIGKIGEYLPMRTVINCLVASAPFVANKTLLDIIPQNDELANFIIALRNNLDNTVISMLSQYANRLVKASLISNPSLSEEQRIIVALF